METESGSTARAASALKLWPSSPAHTTPILFHSVMRNLNKCFQKRVCSSLSSFHSFLRIPSQFLRRLQRWLCRGSDSAFKTEKKKTKLWRNSVPKFSLPIFPSDCLEHLCDLEIGYITQEIGISEMSNIEEKSKCPGEKSATGGRRLLM